MQAFQIEKDIIKCNPLEFKDEVDMVNKARDEVYKLYEEYILLENKTLFFETWDFTTGTINYFIDNLYPNVNNNNKVCR